MPAVEWGEQRGRCEAQVRHAPGRRSALPAGGRERPHAAVAPAGGARPGPVRLRGRLSAAAVQRHGAHGGTAAGGRGRRCGPHARQRLQLSARPVLQRLPPRRLGQRRLALRTAGRGLPAVPGGPPQAHLRERELVRALPRRGGWRVDHGRQRRGPRTVRVQRHCAHVDGGRAALRGPGPVPRGDVSGGGVRAALPRPASQRRGGAGRLVRVRGQRVAGGAHGPHQLQAAVRRLGPHAECRAVFRPIFWTGACGSVAEPRGAVPDLLPGRPSLRGDAAVGAAPRLGARAAGASDQRGALATVRGRRQLHGAQAQRDGGGGRGGDRAGVRGRRRRAAGGAVLLPGVGAA
mmetsp:Transcript_19104/g.60798  ORF Transcript_19104/g.60798 Transcript_19104/m.60798 type:complete len:348 (-) Transcript_19104:338-1381(-)